MRRRDKASWYNLNNPYSYRNENLRAMGFRSYRAYLASDLWKQIRARVLERTGGRCERCRKRPASQIHHRAYDPATLRGENIDSLTAACAGCHKRAELRQRSDSSDLGQTAYQRLQRANTAMSKGALVTAHKRARDERRAKEALAVAIQAWDDTRALAWLAER